MHVRACVHAHVATLSAHHRPTCQCKLLIILHTCMLFTLLGIGHSTKGVVMRSFASDTVSLFLLADHASAIRPLSVSQSPHGRLSCHQCAEKRSEAGDEIVRNYVKQLIEDAKKASKDAVAE